MPAVVINIDSAIVIVDMTSSTSFAANELARALAEQTSSIESFAIKEGGSTELEATADIQLLEGNTVEIYLTSQGYRVSSMIYHLSAMR